MKQKVKFEETILWEDGDYLVINKPPNIATLEDRIDPVNVLGLARAAYPGAQVCHRIDKETSGILVLAKNPEAYRHLSLQFQRREVIKVYHAVVDGIHDFQNVLVDKPIAKSNDGVARISRTGKPAQTYVTSLRFYRMHTLVACRPVTGRMHQIRVHIASLGAPITGDERYGGKPFYLSSVKRGFNLKKEAGEEPLIRRLALHAYSIEFADLSEARVTVEAAYPKDVRALVRQLELNR